VSNRDGRFLSYGKDFTDYLKNEGVVICGPNYIGEMDGIKSKDIPLNTTAFNFRKIRNSFLFSLDNLYTNYEKFIEDFENSLGTISRLPKDLILISNGNLITNKNKAKERIFETFPDLDLGYLYKIEHLFKHNEEMDELFERPDDILSLWDGALTTFEQMIDAFIKKYPK